MEIKFKPIGVIHSPFKSMEDISRERHLKPEGFSSVRGTLEIFPEFEEGLRDIDGYSHLIVIFSFHLAERSSLVAHPPHDGKERGIFATRSPHRPNPIGLTILRLIKRRGRILEVLGIDALEGSPILDIKPYTPRDIKPEAEFGWLEKT
ncbi:MAG: tRNA (N6-threonylcarbamoyladenosine(37)-N6)-methyltransferase TrmO [Acidobacteriota bacterium]